MHKSRLLQEFSRYSDQPPVIISAPGRVNLIGEHTDYNHGFVLPAAIDKRMLIALATEMAGTGINVKAIDFSESLVLDLTDLPDKLKGWQGYLLAIIHEIIAKGLNLRGFSCVFSSDIPIGAGMSSSAALCCGLISALNHEFDWHLTDLEIAKIAQASEHRLGANVGLMDQFAVMYGKKNSAILLDCNDYSHNYIPLDLKEHSLVLINTNIKHQLVDSAYNNRRQSCERTLALLQDNNPAVKTLRDVSLADLDQAEEINPVDLQRVGYVLQENERVMQMVQALKNHDYKQAGMLLYQSHEGLSKEYEVSCFELDLLVELASKENAILGARMMGGGFGGCTINLIKSSEAKTTVSRIRHKYKEQTQIETEYYTVSIADGVKIL